MSEARVRADLIEGRQIRVEPIEALGLRRAILLDPIGKVLERRGLEPAGAKRASRSRVMTPERSRAGARWAAKRGASTCAR